QIATGRCSSSWTRSRFGQTRRTTARRTHGTDSKARLTERRSMVTKLPASLGAALARIVETLLRATSPSTLIERIAKNGWRASHITAIAATRIAATAANAAAVAFIRRTSGGNGAT